MILRINIIDWNFREPSLIFMQDQETSPQGQAN